MDKHIWITDDGREFPVDEMSIPHIVNTIKCLNGTGKKHIDEDYLGGKDKWIAIFKDELKKRNEKIS